MANYTRLNVERAQLIEEKGMLCGKDQHGFPRTGMDVIYPFFILSLCTKGSSRALYDMQEVTHSKNELAFVLPGHILRPISNTDDFTFTWLIVSPEMLLKDNLLPLSGKTMDIYEKAPICHLTDEQVQRLLTILDQLVYINSYSEEQLQDRHQMLIHLMTVGHKLLLMYRHDQDKEWSSSPHTLLFQRFVQLVVTHYKEERNVNWYAKQLGYEPRYFSKLFRVASNGVPPLEWIEQYIVSQAKQMMKANPQLPIKEVAYQLGFSDVPNFYRYFKRATGIYPQAYRSSKAAIHD